MHRRRSAARPIAVCLLLQLTGALTLISVHVAAAQTNLRASAGCPALEKLPADITAEKLRCICYDVCPKEKPDAATAPNQGETSVRPDCAGAETTGAARSGSEPGLSSKVISHNFHDVPLRRWPRRSWTPCPRLNRPEATLTWSASTLPATIFSRCATVPEDES